MQKKPSFTLNCAYYVKFFGSTFFSKKVETHPLASPINAIYQQLLSCALTCHHGGRECDLQIKAAGICIEVENLACEIKPGYKL